MQLIGQKCGMMRVFTEGGASIPVTVIRVEPNRIVQIKDVMTDGYAALQVAYGDKALAKISKPLAGHYAKTSSLAGRGLAECRLGDDEASRYNIGDVLTVDVFQAGDKVDVQAVSKGKGFAGVIKRHHFTMGDASHGNSLSHRVPGSIGQRQTPGRVFKGKKMAGHLGNVKRTVQSQEIVKIDIERNLLMLKGGVPGAPGGRVIIKKAVKGKKKK